MIALIAFAEHSFYSLPSLVGDSTNRFGILARFFYKVAAGRIVLEAATLVPNVTEPLFVN